MTDLKKMLQRAQQNADVSWANSIQTKIDEQTSKATKGAGTDSASTQRKNLATIVNGSIKFERDTQKELERLQLEISEIEKNRESKKFNSEEGIKALKVEFDERSQAINDDYTQYIFDNNLELGSAPKQYPPSPTDLQEADDNQGE